MTDRYISLFAHEFAERPASIRRETPSMQKDCLALGQSGAKAEISEAVEAKDTKFIPEPAEPSWDRQKSNPETGAAAKGDLSLTSTILRLVVRPWALRLRQAGTVRSGL